MRPFTYDRPTEKPPIDAASRFVAGGTNLIDLMKLGVETPERLVDVRHLVPDTIEDTGGGLRVGAGVRNADLAAHPDCPTVLREALLAGASGQLRNLATVGGNLLQRTRCPYFQDVSKPCNKREPGSGCPAIEGDHRNLAVIGYEEGVCVATHPSDMAVALSALDATVVTDRRTVPVNDFYVTDPQRETVLEPGELITHVEVAKGGGSYRKVRDRRSFAFAVVSIAVADGPPARIAFGGLAHKPWRVHDHHDPFPGARPLRDNAFKLTIARNLLREALA